ncbi:hypothetical protein ATK36_4014 [Amycolatopsis sulphurea]|uniref:Uncharacterized protein n=1 Tax=Amycolatopsis sulphurea TaxID=76022 RepID=A0A2A9FDN5_9PSEU|nr:hypothetical protein ATK36_4014 [Amycolatopsis sulphurea]
MRFMGLVKADADSEAGQGVGKVGVEVREGPLHGL